MNVERRKRAAIHESGHVTMAWLCGAAATWATVIPDPEKRNGGHADCVAVPVRWFLNVTLAGAAAESLAGSSSLLDAIRRNTYDTTRARELVGARYGLRVDRAHPLEWWRADRLILERARVVEARLVAVWPAVLEVARTLEARDSLDLVELEALRARLGMPRATPEALRRAARRDRCCRGGER